MKYKKGDVIWVKLEDWALERCSNPPLDGIVKGVYNHGGISSICFEIDKSYGCDFKVIFHDTSMIVDKSSAYEVELL